MLAATLLFLQTHETLIALAIVLVLQRVFHLQTAEKIIAILETKLSPTERTIEESVRGIAGAAKKEPPALPPGAAGMILCLWFGCLALLGPCCTRLPSPTGENDVATSAVTATVDAGCALVGIVDSEGAAAGAICEDFAPLVAKLVMTLVRRAETADAGAAMAFVPLLHKGVAIGYVRRDLAADVTRGLAIGP